MPYDFGNFMNVCYAFMGLSCSTFVTCTSAPRHWNNQWIFKSSIWYFN